MILIGLTSRHVHDRQLPPDLLHLHGLYPLQDPHPSHSRYPTRLRTFRDPRNFLSSLRREAGVHIDELDDVGARDVQGQCDGAVTYNKVGLASMGGGEDLEREGGAKGVVVRRRMIKEALGRAALKL